MMGVRSSPRPSNLQQLQQQLLILESNPNLIHNNNDENSLSYQTDKIIDNTRKIQLKESTNMLNGKPPEGSSIVDVTVPGVKEAKIPTYI